MFLWTAIVLLSLLVRLNATFECSLEDCNFAGICKSDSKCVCFDDKYFKGPHCTEMPDNCNPNPCDRAAKCTNALGQHFCASDPSLYTKPFVHCNRYANYAEYFTFLVTVETLGTAEYQFELATETLGIALFGTSVNDPKFTLAWKPSDDLIQLAQSLGLRHADQMPYRKGYYYTVRTVFWEVGTLTVQAQAYRLPTQFWTADYKIEVFPPKSADCVPYIEFKDCCDPKFPQFVDFAHYNFFEPVIKRRCSRDSKISLYWWTFDFLGAVKQRYIGRSNTTHLKVPPYGLHMEYQSDHAQMIRVEARETIGDKCIRTVAECYADAMRKPVFVDIVGGETREVTAGKPFLLDGSKSRDFALPPDVYQKMLYRWHCKSLDDEDNTFCQESIGKENELSVSPYALKSGKSYEFSLRAKSLYGYGVIGSAKQLVKVVGQGTLDVAINCVRNCAQRTFMPGKLLHLQGKCLPTSAHCHPKATFSWTLNGNNAGNTARLINTPGDQNELKAELLVDAGGLQGKASITLKKSTLPRKGSCSVDPAKGEEYNTVITVHCMDFADEDTRDTLVYEFTAEGYVAARSTFPMAKLRLPATNKLDVLICNRHGACVDEQKPVAITAVPLPADSKGLRAYLEGDEPHNLKKLVLSGDRQAALALLHVVTKHQPSVDTAHLLDELLRDFKPNSLLESEQMALITTKLLNALKPLDNKSAKALAPFYGRLANGLRQVVEDGEVTEMSSTSYERLIRAVAEIIAAISIESEEIPAPQTIGADTLDANDPLADKYADMPAFNLDALPRINNWLDNSRKVHECLHWIGHAGTTAHEPMEPVTQVERDNTKIEVRCIEGNEEQTLKTQNTEITLTPALLHELQQQLASNKLVFQMVYIELNPFWWYPQAMKLATPVFYASVFGVTRAPIKLQNALKFKVKRVTDSQLYPTSSGRLKSRGHMPIYAIAVPGGSLLVVTFQVTNADLFVDLQLNTKPRGNKLRKEHKPVPAGSTNKFFAVTNPSRITATAYLAVLGQADKAEFSFTSVLHECVTWQFYAADPAWQAYGCLPVSISDDSFNCECTHFSAFAGRERTANVSPGYGNQMLLDELPINYYFITAVLLCVLLLLYLLIRAYCKLNKGRNQLTAEVNDEHPDTQYNVRVIATALTGARLNAGSTATIFLTLYSKSDVQSYVFYQNPDNPKLRRYSTCTLIFPYNSNEFATLTAIGISRDATGRYASWYCSQIEIKELNSGKTRTFEVQRWITTETQVFYVTDHAPVPTKKRVFSQHLECFYTNCYRFQPLFGPWKYGGANRFERTCISIARISVTFCMVACYFGTTTMENYEAERERYRRLGLNWTVLLLLCFCSYLACLLIELGFYFLLRKNQAKQ